MQPVSSIRIFNCGLFHTSTRFKLTELSLFKLIHLKPVSSIRIFNCGLFHTSTRFKLTELSLFKLIHLKRILRRKSMKEKQRTNYLSLRERTSSVINDLTVKSSCVNPNMSQSNIATLNLTEGKGKMYVTFWYDSLTS